jgi:EpsI family protein
MTVNTNLRHSNVTKVLALVFAAVFCAGFLPTLLSLHRRWSNFDEAYSHGYLLLLLAGYLFWQYGPLHHTNAGPVQRVLRRLPVEPLCIAVIAATSLAWLLFLLAGITALQQLALPILLLCGAGAIGGTAVLRRAAVPCALIYLAIPVWDELLTTPLQALSTAVSGWTIRHLFGIPVSIDGFHIQIPAGTFEIQGGCSGLVFLLTALTLGIAYGQLFLHSVRGRLLCVMIAAMMGIVVNWIRIISLILIGHYTAMRSPLIGEGHLMFGFYIFGGISLVIIFIATRLAPVPSASHAPAATRSATTGRNAALAIAALALGPLTLLLLRGLEPAAMSLTAPATIGASLTRLQAPSRWQPDFPGAPVAASYRASHDSAIDVHLVCYPNPFGAGKLVSQRNHPLPTNWKTQRRTSMMLPNHASVLESHVVDDQGQALLVWSWYRVGDDIVATESAARLAQLRNAVRLRLDGSFVSMSTRCLFPDCALSAGPLERHASQIIDDTSRCGATRQSDDQANTQ